MQPYFSWASLDRISGQPLLSNHRSASHWQPRFFGQRFKNNKKDNVRNRYNEFCSGKILRDRTRVFLKTSYWGMSGLRVLIIKQSKHLQFTVKKIHVDGYQLQQNYAFSKYFSSNIWTAGEIISAYCTALNFSFRTIARAYSGPQQAILQKSTNLCNH